MPREECTATHGPVSRAICVFQEKWVLHIVHQLLDGPRGFNDLGRDVGGCNPTTLTQRLARLEELGLVCRSPECEGARSAYALTEAGEALREVIAAIRAWSTSHLTEHGVAHQAVVDVPTRRPETATPAAPSAASPPTAGRASAAASNLGPAIAGPASGASVGARGAARVRAREERPEAHVPHVADGST